jgi:Arc/MetJ-type ribon-helix-helix transcriptional regulator
VSAEIPAEFVPCIRDMIASGQYTSESDVIADALRLLRQSHRDRNLVEEGLDQLERGEFLEFDDAGLQQFLEQAQQQAFKELRAEGRPEK